MKIHVEKKGDDYFVDSVIVTDPLNLTVRQRKALREFKKTRQSGMKIKSTIKDD